MRQNSVAWRKTSWEYSQEFVEPNLYCLFWCIWQLVLEMFNMKPLMINSSKIPSDRFCLYTPQFRQRAALSVCWSRFIRVQFTSSPTPSSSSSLSWEECTISSHCFEKMRVMCCPLRCRQSGRVFCQDKNTRATCERSTCPRHFCHVIMLGQ